jgi:hypothetical protein
MLYPAGEKPALGLALPLLELLDDLALLLVLGWFLSEVRRREEVSPFFFSETLSPALASFSFLLRSSVPPLQRFMPIPSPSWPSHRAFWTIAL